MRDREVAHMHIRASVLICSIAALSSLHLVCLTRPATNLSGWCT